MPELQVYGLLHLQSGERSAMNAGTRDFADQTRLYGANALTLARSLALQGIRFTLTPSTRRRHGVGFDRNPCPK